MVDEENGIFVDRLDGFLKISHDPVEGFCSWRKNKLFQIKAHPPVKIACPGKFVFVFFKFLHRKNARIFGMHTRKLSNCIFGDPAGGSSPCGLSHAIRIIHMACTDVQVILY